MNHTSHGERDRRYQESLILNHFPPTFLGGGTTGEGDKFLDVHITVIINP